HARAWDALRRRARGGGAPSRDEGRRARRDRRPRADHRERGPDIGDARDVHSRGRRGSPDAAAPHPAARRHGARQGFALARAGSPCRRARASERADRLMPTSILALGVMLSAFLVGLVIGGPYIQLLRRLRVGQNIRREGPSRDFAKQGIPTMGGLLFIGVVAFLWVFVLFLLPESEREVYVPQTIVPIGALVAVGALGAIDDWVNVTYGFGIRGRHKLVWQTIVGLAAAVYIQRHFGVDEVFIPLVGGWVIGGVIFVLVALIAIVATSNGVNLTDGMDGLAGGTSVFAFLSFAFIAAARHYDWLVVFCAAPDRARGDAVLAAARVGRRGRRVHDAGAGQYGRVGLSARRAGAKPRKARAASRLQRDSASQAGPPQRGRAYQPCGRSMAGRRRSLDGTPRAAARHRGGRLRS